ncbi:hypothetical protein ACFQ07_31050, partial [Actinomadura adrarensis]
MVGYPDDTIAHEYGALVDHTGSMYTGKVVSGEVNRPWSGVSVNRSPVTLAPTAAVCAPSGGASAGSS